jgi:hypothetical protein
MSRLLVPLLIGAAALVGGCYGTTGTYGTYGYASATVATPDLVYAGPGVYAVAGYDEPIYYADDYYWRYYDGYWFRSHYLGGWSYYPQPPRAIISIGRPYAHYHRYTGRSYVDRRYPTRYRDHRYRSPTRVYRGTPRGYRYDRGTRYYDRGTTRGYRDYRGSPRTYRGDRSYRSSPRTYRGDRSYRSSPRTDRGDRSYRSSPRVIDRSRARPTPSRSRIDRGGPGRVIRRDR